MICMKIGVLGGTFNPFHNGHLNIVKEIDQIEHFDKVLFIPTGVSYMKEGVLPAVHRLNMTTLSLENTGYEVSDIDIKREGNTYTKDTVADLMRLYPSSDIYFIIGTDTLYMIEKWSEFRTILDNVTLCIYGRDVDEEEPLDAIKERFLNDYCAKMRFYDFETIDISSSLIRNRLKEGKVDSVKPFINARILDYIKLHNIYRNMNCEEILERLKVDLKESRIIHSLGVKDMAAKLGNIYGCDIEKCNKAALLHDCAKYLSTQEKTDICDRWHVKISEVEFNNPELLHSKAGALRAAEEYGIEDPDIISAIFYHTVGRAEMTLLEKIIFVSDYIEVNRTHSDKLPYFRELALTDLDRTVALIYKETLTYLEMRKDNKVKSIDPETQKAYEFYKQYLRKEDI